MPERKVVDTYLSSRLELTVRKPCVDVSVVELRGVLDVSSTAVIRDRLISELGSGHRLMLDLSQLVSMDRAGVGLLAGLLRRLRDHGGELILFSPAPPVRRILEFTRLDRVIQIGDQSHLVHHIIGQSVNVTH